MARKSRNPRTEPRNQAKSQTGIQPGNRNGSHDNTADRIIEAATRLFAQKGYDGTSTKEICDAAEVNIAAIHYHFNSKEELLRHIIERFGASGLESAQRILQAPRNQEELKVRLQLFLQETIEAIARQPEVAEIIQREAELFHRRSEDIFRNSFSRTFETLAEFLGQARKARLIAKDIDPLFAAHTLFVQISSLSRMDRIAQGRHGISIKSQEFRSRWEQETLRLFLGGILEKA